MINNDNIEINVVEKNNIKDVLNLLVDFSIGYSLLCEILGLN